MSAAVSLAPERVRLRVLTNSEISCARRCQREWHFRYRLLRRPRIIPEALRFGTLQHHALEAWWRVVLDGAEDIDNLLERRIEAALAAIAGHGKESDEYEIVKAEELMLGYTARWGHITTTVLGVEAQFSAPLINPETGAPSKTFELGGKLDVLTTEGFVEHKTTSADIELGSDYWRRVSALDSQVSMYDVGSRALGVDGPCTYDVIRKPDIRPRKATPVESRKYTKPKVDKKTGEVLEPSRLYADQREFDETPEEFRMRLRADIAEKPEKYYARGEIVRLEADKREHAADTWRMARMMREAEVANAFPRNPDACMRYGSTCDYFLVCSGEANIDDDARFRTAESAHEELENKEIR